jgi:hypothetical protein
MLPAGSFCFDALPSNATMTFVSACFGIALATAVGP